MKIILSALLMLLVFSPTAPCSTLVTITGKGATREEAVSDALRTAVEKAAGVFVYSLSETKNFSLVNDKIVSASRGYVKDYRIVSEVKQEGVIFLTLAVSVDSEAIKTRFRNDIRAVTYDDILKDYYAVKHEQTSLHKIADILKTLCTRPLNELYIVDYTGYEIKNVGMNSATIGIKFKIRLNPFFWDTYNSVLVLGKSANKEAAICTNYKLTSFIGEYYYRGNVSHLPTDLFSYVLRPRTASCIIDFAGVHYRMTGFRFYDTMISSLYNLDRFVTVNPQSDSCDIGPFSEKTARGISIIPDEGVEFIKQFNINDTVMLKSLASIKIALVEE
jgi:hypothetical protein